MKIFFYGLFMDERLLATKGIAPADVRVGCIDGYALRIGERATLIREPDARAYGAVMEITPDEAAMLYAEDSVADYVPESVSVELADGGKVEATCYNLPATQIAGTNTSYAGSLLKVAEKLGLPEPYLDEIRRAREPIARLDESTPGRRAESMPILNSILATLYALYVTAGIYMFVMRGLSLVQMALLVITVITILALTRRFGNWTRIVGLIYASLMLFVGITMIGFGVWQVVTESSEYIAFVAIGAVIGAIAAATIWALRAPAGPLENDPV